MEMKIKIIYSKMYLEKTEIKSVKIKKTFVFNGYTFAVHRPYNGLMNDSKGGFQSNSWAVSEFTTGARIGSSYNRQSTIKQAIAYAIEKLSAVSADELREKISRFQPINKIQLLESKKCEKLLNRSIK
jgi:hypothetical protein